MKLDALPTLFNSTDQTPSVLVIVNNPEILTAVEETERPMPNVIVNESENKVFFFFLIFILIKYSKRV